MPEPTLTYLTLPEGVGVASPFIRDPKSGLDVPNPKAGEPEPINNIGLQIPVPVMVDGEVADTTTRVPIQPGPALGPEGQLVDNAGVFQRARIIPGSRVVETDHPAVVNLLQEAGLVPCDPPASAQPRRPQTDASKED